MTPIQPIAPIHEIVPLKSLVPISYGWGPAPHAIGLGKTTLGPWSLPWDPLTSSYGGWVPIKGASLPSYDGPYATIFSKRFNDKGKLTKSWVTGPIPLYGGKLVMKTKH